MTGSTNTLRSGVSREEENLDFIFKDHPDKELVKSIFIKTHTNNIRVLRKTRWLIDELLPLIKEKIMFVSKLYTDKWTGNRNKSQKQ